MWGRKSDSLVAILIELQLDVFEDRYPWVAELVDEGFGTEEIVDLILKSENLQWIEAEHALATTKRPWRGAPRIGHLEDCAHKSWLKIIRMQKATQLEDASKYNDSIAQRGEQQDSASRPDPFLNPLDFVADLEAREQKIVQACGIGGIFPPSFEDSNPGSVILLGGQARVMFGDQRSVSAIRYQVTQALSSLKFARSICSHVNLNRTPFGHRRSSPPSQM